MDKIVLYTFKPQVNISLPGLFDGEILGFSYHTGIHRYDIPPDRSSTIQKHYKIRSGLEERLFPNIARRKLAAAVIIAHTSRLQRALENKILSEQDQERKDAIEDAKAIAEGDPNIRVSCDADLELDLLAGPNEIRKAIQQHRQIRKAFSDPNYIRKLQTTQIVGFDLMDGIKYSGYVTMMKKMAAIIQGEYDPRYVGEIFQNLYDSGVDQVENFRQLYEIFSEQIIVDVTETQADSICDRQ